MQVCFPSQTGFSLWGKTARLSVPTHAIFSYCFGIDFDLVLWLLIKLVCRAMCPCVCGEKHKMDYYYCYRELVLWNAVGERQLFLRLLWWHFLMSPDFKPPFCLSSQTKAHLSALFTWNTGGHWGKCSSTQVRNPEMLLTLPVTTVLCVTYPTHDVSVF